MNSLPKESDLQLTETNACKGCISNSANSARMERDGLMVFSYVACAERATMVVEWTRARSMKDLFMGDDSACLGSKLLGRTLAI